MTSNSKPILSYISTRAAPKPPILMILSFLCVVVFLSFYGNGVRYTNIWKENDNRPKVGTKETTPPYKVGDSGSLDDGYEYSHKEPTNDEIHAELELNLPNIPFAYTHRHENRTMRKSKNCASYPSLTTLRYYNNYWQTYNIDNITFQLYGAYYDARADVSHGPVIRILALINQLKAPFPTSHCHIWYENEEIPDIVPIIEYKSIWKFGGSKMFFPYLMTCTPPPSAVVKGERIPQAVSVVVNKCDSATNVLKVIYERPPKTAEKWPFAVCVKGLDFPYVDLSERLAEWLEVQRLLGAHKVYMYEIAVHPNVKKVLAHYQSEGFVEVRPITLVGGVVALPHMQHWLLSVTRFNKRLNELVPYNDCFYRHMYKYDYIALVDIDEIIMPVGKLRTWQSILEAAVPFEKSKNCSEGFAGLCFSNTYLPFNTANFTIIPSTDNNTAEITPAPSYMFLLNHPYRSSNYSRTGHAAKCLHRTSKALVLHNHYPMEWLNSCRPLNMPCTVGQLQHYHNFKPNDEFNALVADYNVERFRKPLIERTTQVLHQVGHFK